MYSEILILALLKQRPRHGYELRKDVASAFDRTISLNNKTLYPALKRFEEMGAVIRRIVPQEGKPDRHLYQLTESGVELLRTYLRDFSSEQAASDAEFSTRVAFFEELKPQEREEILKKRLAYVQTRFEHLQRLQQQANETNTSPQSHAGRILAFHFQQTREEYQWLAAWLAEMQAQVEAK